MKLDSIKNCFKKHQKFWLSLLIFALIFILLGLPFYNWGFMNDDFGVVFHSKVKNLKDILRFFIEGHSGDSLQPSNFVPAEKTFFQFTIALLHLCCIQLLLPFADLIHTDIILHLPYFMH